VFKLAFRNVIRNRRRLAFLCLSVAAAFFVVCLVQGLVGGILEKLNERGARFYGGHVLAVGYVTSEDRDVIVDQEAVSRAFASLGFSDQAVSRRSYGMVGSVYFQGDELAMRRIIGIDWEREAHAVNSMEILEGNPALLADGRHVLISDVAAKRLGLHSGDELTIKVQQAKGRIDTDSLVVAAIFKEASIFGYYTTWMDRRTLNRLLGHPADACSMMGIYLEDFRLANVIKERLCLAVAEKLPVFPALADQEAYKRLRSEPYDGVRYGVLTIHGYMYEIQTMVNAMLLVSYAVLVLIFLVIAVGVTNTYKIFMFERIREIGTMRAMGMQAGAVRNLVLAESFIIAVFGMIVGLLAGITALSLIGLKSFSAIPGLDIMLKEGRLGWSIPLDTLLVDAVMVSCITMAGALGPARQASRLQAAEALRSE